MIVDEIGSANVNDHSPDGKVAWYDNDTEPQLEQCYLNSDRGMNVQIEISTMNKYNT